MHSFELSKLQAVTAPRALSDTDRTAAKPASPSSPAADAAPTPAAKTGVSLEVSASVNTAAPPVDNDRVQQIKSALQDGSYPLVPAEIADAIIAAQVGFGIDR
ncbi:MAG: flagellar biosynthesis anti-sigma factor FlgM [Pseudomonadota bacterium]